MSKSIDKNIADLVVGQVTSSTPSGYGSNNNPFTSLKTVVYQNGQTAVTWTLDPNFEDQGPYSYYLEVAKSDALVLPEEFERLNPDNPVIDHLGYVLDETMRRYSFDNRVVYRMVLETPRGTYVSDPEKPNGNLPPHLLRVYREILRKERLRLNPKMGGTDGTLFKRRTFGPKCTEAIDKNTGQVVDYNNSECFGTEYIGGYFAGLHYPMLYTSGESYSAEITQMGTQEPHTITARSLVYPIPASKDVWYEQDTGRAFYVDKITVTSKFSSKPLSLKIEMKMAAPTDIIYDFIDVQAELAK